MGRGEAPGSGTDGNHSRPRGCEGAATTIAALLVSRAGVRIGHVGHTPEDDGRDVFAGVLAEPLDGGDFLLRRARPDDLAHVLAVTDDVMCDASGR